MNTFMEKPATLAEILADHGWVQADQACSPQFPGGTWTRLGPAGLAHLTCEPSSSPWVSWSLRGGAVPSIPATHVLWENANFTGPGKLVATPQGIGSCRIDAPRELFEATIEDAPFDDPLAAVHPLESLVQAMTALATGDTQDLTTYQPKPPELVGRLEKQGWSAKVSEEGVTVTVSLPGLFRHIIIAEQPSNGPHLWCDLVDLAGWPMECRQAALGLAQAANNRLYLVRFSAHESAEGESLVAEVPWAGSLTFLEMALETLQAAIVLTTRELAALHDPVLAKLTLAGLSAGLNPEGGSHDCPT